MKKNRPFKHTHKLKIGSDVKRIWSTWPKCDLGSNQILLLQLARAQTCENSSAARLGAFWTKKMPKLSFFMAKALSRDYILRPGTEQRLLTANFKLLK